MTCKICGYQWTTRTKHPKKCPNPLCQAVLIKYPDPDKLPKKALETPPSPTQEVA